jgi:hypothetical protein
LGYACTSRYYQGKSEVSSQRSEVRYKDMNAALWVIYRVLGSLRGIFAIERSLVSISLRSVQLPSPQTMGVVGCRQTRVDNVFADHDNKRNGDHGGLTKPGIRGLLERGMGWWLVLIHCLPGRPTTSYKLSMISLSSATHHRACIDY